jgi:hypothetical protein
MYREIDPFPFDFINLEKVRHHLLGEIKNVSVSKVRGIDVPPYICPKVKSISKKVSLIFMSFGYKNRSSVLLKSLVNQKGINSNQLEIIACTNDDINTSDMPFKVIKLPLQKKTHKSLILNNASKKADGDILVFIDADALLPPYFIANVIYNVVLDKLYVSVRKNLDYTLAEILIKNQKIIPNLDYLGLRDILPYYWSYNFLSYTPSGFMHVIQTHLFIQIGRYDESFVNFSDYDWEFASRVAKKFGQPILVPDMWAIHLDHPKDYTGEQIRKMGIKL